MIRLPLTRNNVINYARRYQELMVGTNDEKIENELLAWFDNHKFLDRTHFLKLCLWKSPRPKKHYEDAINSDERIKYITSLAISSTDEYFKISSLQLLKGVSMPVASVILHFARPDKYPILDFRAIWSLGWQQPKQYTFEFWEKYCNYIRETAKSLKVSLRILDKALWQYSKEHQK